MRINYWRISLHHNLSRKCRKIVKFVSITHRERNIWNGPIVATAISRKKRKPVLGGNGCTWPPRSPGLTVCGFFLWGFVKDNFYVPPPHHHFQRHYHNCGQHINTAMGNVTQDMLERVCRKWEYRPDIYRVTRGAHIECI